MQLGRLRKGSNAMESLAIRNTLDELIRSKGEDYASLSRLIGRNPTYIQQFIRRGIPRKLSEEDRRILARHLDVPESLLGGPQDRVGRAVNPTLVGDLTPPFCRKLSRSYPCAGGRVRFAVTNT